MDSTTLTTYGYLVVALIVLVAMMAFATPLGDYVVKSINNTLKAERTVESKALEEILHVTPST